jgi:hypothetical protein
MKTRKTQREFDRSKLPSPISVLERLGIHPGRQTNSAFFLMKCPFHKGGHERHPSLGMHKEEGFYRCHSCGAKGDLLAFFMQVTKKGFVECAKELGAWREIV